ncbi:O-antigen ligase family protein [Flavobacteriales bacterium]|nr:O-antigen ligase family protein [Flavobacteriales bacterium]
MHFENIKHKVNYYSLLLIAFMLPLKKELIPLLILLFFLSGTFRLRKNLNTKKAFLLLSLFGIYLAGLLYSKNTNEGIQNIETKLSLIIFPVAFFFSRLHLNTALPRVMKSFIEGCTVSILLGLVASTIRFYYTRDVTEFFYGKLSYFSHSSYFSMYLNFGILTLYYFSFHPNKNTYIKPNISLSLIIFFSLIIFLLSSKTGVFTLVITHFVALTYLIIKHKKLVKGIIGITAVISIFLIGYNKAPIIQNRLNEVITSFSNNEIPTSSTQYRIEAWKTATALILKNPIYGYGTGGTRDLLTKEYKIKKIEFLVEQRLNCHNQYIEVALNSGVIGLFILILLLALPIIWAVKYRNYIILFFILLISFNFLTESMLETQSGVVFFSFFYTILIHAQFSTYSVKTDN